MKKVKLYIPKLEDLWFREECMSDPKTMSYNAGYNVSYYGYHYETGCIDFPEEKWEEWNETKLKNPNFFFAYILDENEKKFVGYLNFNMNPETKKATTGIVIKDDCRGKGYMRPALKLMFEYAREKGVKVLTDTVPQNRESALKVFYELGFVKAREFESKKFNKIEIVDEIEKTL